MSPEQAVLAALTRMGGGVTLRELIYQTQLPRDVVLDALVSLEEQGHAAPYSWCTSDVFARMLSWASQGGSHLPRKSDPDEREGAKSP